MSEKAKNEKVTKPTISPINFVLLWVAVTTAMTYLGAGVKSWSVTLGFLNSFYRSNNYSFWAFLLLINLIEMAGMALIQKRILRLSFGHSFNGWVWASLLGAILSMIPRMLSPITTTTGFIYVLQSALMVLPLAWVLRKQIKHSWLLVLSRMLAAFIGFSIYTAYGYSSDLVSLALGAALPSAGMALTMLWLFREMFSQQNNSASTADEQHERLLDRLEENLVVNDENLEEAQANS